MTRKTRFCGLKSQMRKQGPCDHCGVAESPLWRNGPTEKPVLCNACGSRWRLRRSLRNYVPNHSYVLRKRKLRKTDTDFCYYGNAVKIEEDDSLCSDGIQTSDELIACPSLKSSSESAISDQPTVKIEPVGEDENPEGAGIDQPCIVEVPSENWHFSHIEDLHRNLWELYVNRRFASSYEPKEVTLIYHDTPLAPSIGKESTLGVVLLEPPKIPKKEISKALPLLLGADISIVEAPKRRKPPSKAEKSEDIILHIGETQVGRLWSPTEYFQTRRFAAPPLTYPDQMLEAEEWRVPAMFGQRHILLSYNIPALLALCTFLGLVGLITIVIYVIGQLSFCIDNA